ncbi:MAG: MFS transporter [Dysgonomonas sp.]
MKQLNKYFTFLGLYVAQAIPMSFFTTVVPVIMRQENYSLESIGLLQLVKIPWILKFIWAPLIDKKANTLSQYKKWIISSEIFYAVLILSIGFFSLQTNFNLIIVFVVLAVFASATQDIATDALAVLTLKKEQRSMGNAVQSIGGFTGALVGSGLLLLIYNYFGWKALLAGLAGFVLIALLPLYFFNYPLRKKPLSVNVSLKNVLSFFTQKGIGKHIIFLLLSTSGLTGIMSMLKPYMVDHGFDIAEIGFISGILGTSTAVVFALSGGLILKKLSMTKALASFLTLAVITILYFIWINSKGFTKIEITVAVCALWGTYGLLNVSLYTLAMSWARQGFEGTDFTAQLVINQLGSLVIAALSGFIAQKLHYQGLFIAEIILAVFTLIYVTFVYRERIEE